MTDIALPTDDRPSRIRRTAPATPIPVDDVAQTLAEYTRLALSTGARLEIDPVEFTADGEVWVTLWLREEHPAGARAKVRRDGVETIVERPWREALPGEEALTDTGRRWIDIWTENPTERFESYVLRLALARAFADVIGDRFDMGKPRIPRPTPREPAEGEPAPQVTPEQAAEVDAAVAALPWAPAPAAPVPHPPAAGIPRLYGGAA